MFRSEIAYNLIPATLRPEAGTSITNDAISLVYEYGSFGNCRFLKFNWIIWTEFDKWET